jgi:hypothetical protein
MRKIDGVLNTGSAEPSDGANAVPPPKLTPEKKPKKPPPTKRTPAPVPEIIFDVSGNVFYVPRPDKPGYHSLHVEALRRYLKAAGLSGEADEYEDLSEVDTAICRAENFNRVDLVGNFAGYHRAEIYEISGLRILVPQPKVRAPLVEGEWPFIEGFTKGLIPRAIEYDVVRAWTQLSWKSLQNEPGYWTPAPVLALLWPTRNGKSSYLKKILAPPFGKWADPTKYFIKATSFNEDLGEAELWGINDPKWDTRAEKEAFARGFKGGVADSVLSVHPKFRKQELLDLYRRIVITLNDEDEPLSIFPLLPRSTLEKIIFISTDVPDKEYLPTVDNWPEWCRRVEAELPAYLYDTVYKFKIPDEIADRSYGVRYHNTAIEEKIAALTPGEKEIGIERIIREAVFPRSEIMPRNRPRREIIRTEELAARLFDPRFRLSAQVREAKIPVAIPWLARLLHGLARENGGRRSGFILEPIGKRDNQSRFLFTELRDEEEGE